MRLSRIVFASLLAGCTATSALHYPATLDHHHRYQFVGHIRVALPPSPGPLGARRLSVFYGVI